MGQIIKQNLSNYAYDAMANYSASVILDRAIPDARDGLKPVQRRIMWQTHLSKLNSSAKYMKLAKLSGLTLAYHAHGSGSISSAAVNLSQSWLRSVPLIDIQGNNGSIDGASAAADRYIEARQAVGAELLLNKINHNAVDLIDNFDNTEKEPRVLPAAFPVAMTNGASGIAVGISTKILPHNPLELLDASIKMIKNEIKENKDLYSIIKGPDFPTGGYIIGKSGCRDEINTGKGKFTVRGKVKYNTKGKEPYLEIVEIPYGVTTTKLIDKIAQALENAKALGVIDIRDETQDNHDISIKLICKKGTNQDQLEKIESYLYKKTDLELTLSSNNIMITKGHQKTLNMWDYLEQFIEFRKETLKRIWRYDLNKLINRKEILEGLLRTYDITEEIINLAKQSQNKKHLADMLIEKHKFTERQAQTIAGMPIYQLGKQDFERLNQELNENITHSDNLNKWLNNDNETNLKLIEDLEYSMQKLSDYKRRTKVINPSQAKEAEDITVEDVIESKEMKVVIKKDLQMFQIGQRAFDNQIKNYKDEDIIAYTDALTTEYITAITKQGKTVTRLVNDLDQSTLEAGSESLNKSIPDLKSNDEFIGCVVNDIANESQEKVMIISNHGYVKLISAEKLRPSLKTKSYMKKTGLASTLKKQGDFLTIMEVIDKKIFDDLELHIVLNDKSKKSGIVNRYIELSKWSNKNYGTGGSGFKGVNTKDGSLTYKEHHLYKKDKTNETNDEN